MGDRRIATCPLFPESPRYVHHRLYIAGARDDAERDAGALGNIVAGADGIATFDFVDKHLKLLGPLSVIGRSVVVTAGEDDGGKGSAASSAIDGSAGAVIAAGVLGISG